MSVTQAGGAAAQPVASLPMYDWPEVEDATDALWALLRDALRARGLPAPEALSRDAYYWGDPALALGQTCFMPFRLGLHAETTLIGSADYGLEGCPPGRYRSALVARAADPRERIEDFRGARFAFNDVASQSGWGALLSVMGPLDPGAGIATGAHRLSIGAVAEGRADVAAIDAVSWRLAGAWEPAAARLRVIGWTRPTLGAPFITAKGRDPAPYRAAAAEAIAALEAASRAALGILSFVPATAADYLSEA